MGTLDFGAQASDNSCAVPRKSAGVAIISSKRRSGASTSVAVTRNDSVKGNLGVAGSTRAARLAPVWLLVRSHGVLGALRLAARRLIRGRARTFRVCGSAFSNSVGFEVGGPSGIFSSRGLLPVYRVVDRVDNCNFAPDTAWEAAISEGPTYRPDQVPWTGRQYLREATDLDGIPSDTYDVILSSHVIEHLANPLRALREWIRVLRPEGYLLLVAPHRDGTFDHRRPVTPLEHMIADFDAGVGEDDLTHLEEIVAYHDLSRDPPAGGPAAFRRRGEDNFQNRCLHHHVFTTPSFLRILDHVELEIRAVEPTYPHHIIVLARAPSAAAPPDNRRWLSDHAAYRKRSPFTSDRLAD